jgi:hypothetical protein
MLFIQRPFFLCVLKKLNITAQALNEPVRQLADCQFINKGMLFSASLFLCVLKKLNITAQALNEPVRQPVG